MKLAVLQDRPMKHELAIINLDTARFECTFGRGCDGVCCRQGRPLVYPEEIANISAHLDKFLGLLRPEARAVIERKGFVASDRHRPRHGIMRSAQGWCVFFKNGCVLQQVGAVEGEKFRYKPALCALFPIQQDPHDRWYIRQQGYKRERWNLFCLNPKNSTVPAAQSLADEIALASRFDREQEEMASRQEPV